MVIGTYLVYIKYMLLNGISYGTNVSRHRMDHFLSERGLLCVSSGYFMCGADGNGKYECLPELSARTDAGCGRPCWYAVKG